MSLQMDKAGLFIIAQHQPGKSIYKVDFALGLIGSSWISKLSWTNFE